MALQLLKLVFFCIYILLLNGPSIYDDDVTYGQVWWPILGISVLHLTYPKCTHTAVNTHPEQLAAIYSVAAVE